MTKEGREAIGIVTSLGLDPKRFSNQNAANVQKLVAFKNEGMCDLDYVKSHISLDPTLSSSGVKEIEGKIFNLQTMERFGVDPRIVEGVKKYDPPTVAYESTLHLFYLILDKEGRTHTTWEYSAGQVNWLVRFLYFGGMDFAVKYCNPSFKEEQLRDIFYKNKCLF